MKYYTIVVPYFGSRGSLVKVVDEESRDMWTSNVVRTPRELRKATQQALEFEDELTYTERQLVERKPVPEG